MKLGIVKKLVASFILLILFSMLILLFISLNSIKKNYLNYTKKHLLHLARATLFYIIDEDSLSINSKELQKKIKILSNMLSARITIILPNGKVIVDSEKDAKTMENHKNRPEIKNAIENGFGYKIRFSNTLKRNMIYVAIPFYKENKLRAVIRVSCFVDEEKTLLNSIMHHIIIMALLVIIFSIFIFMILTYHFTNPIKKLVDASKEVSKGNYKVKLSTNNSDEIYDLTRNFNYMLKKIKTQISELQIKSEELSSIINSIKEIFWIIDRFGKITFYNKAFIDFIGINKEMLKSNFYWTTIKNPDLIEKIKKILNSNKNIKEEIHIEEKYYILSSSFLQKSSSRIFLLSDITEIKKLNEIKKDFVINASHELKTPLTTIKGFLETLQFELGGNYSFYIDILKRNTNRLINIVNDILLLAEVESSQNFFPEKMDIRKILKNSINILKNQANRKAIMIDYEFKDIPKIFVDPFKLEQVFVNLIDNAIKYSDENSKIQINVLEESEFIRIDFIDTGIGIKKSDIARIFERFYVVDKSRSRKVGGTGLGLSIVKHIIQLHKGKMEIYSEYGKGTTVTIWLPI